MGVVIQRTNYSMYNFIFAATGVVIRGTFCKKSLFSVPSLLLFTAQFDFLRIFRDFCKISDFSVPVVIRSTIPAKIFFEFLGVGIEHTI